MRVATLNGICFNGTSTKTRIETKDKGKAKSLLPKVLMEHPPKQGLKLRSLLQRLKTLRVLMEHPPKQGLKQSWNVFNAVN